MCHFYANPLSVTLAEDDKLLRQALQPEHLEAVRMSDSFRDLVSDFLWLEYDPAHVRRFLEDDKFLIKRICAKRQWGPEKTRLLLRPLLLMRSTGFSARDFIDDYIDALSFGINPDDDGSSFIKSLRQLQPDDLVALARRLLSTINDGDPEMGVAGWTEESEDFVPQLREIIDEVKSLQDRSAKNGTVLRSKYSAQSRVLRTTVVAQKVQLSHDSAKLTDEDKAFTAIVKKLENLLVVEVSCLTTGGFLAEAWEYDSKSPNRDVFIPRPGTTIERALSRPHDYLACKCCSNIDGDTAATLPAAAILYHLYMEAGALINVADLWSAYYALVGEEENEQGGLEEREALARFYQGLAELKTMGFVKQSKKKADHIAKVKWL
jgi:origin recognition complex subunit 3